MARTEQLNDALDTILDDCIEAMVEAGMNDTASAYRGLLIKAFGRLQLVTPPDVLRADLDGYERTVQGIRNTLDLG